MWKPLPVIALAAALLAGCAPARSAPPAAPIKPTASSAAPAASGPAASAARPGPSRQPVTIRFGDIPGTYLAALYIARERGYFREEALDVELETFDTAESMIPALATNQLNVGSGGVSAGMFSAIGRGLPIKIVAGVSRNEVGMSSSALVVRKDLIDSGRVRDLADLRGLRFALPSQSAGLAAEYQRILEQGGLSEADIDLKLLSFHDTALAITNGAIDASMLTEPFIARLVQSGAAVRWKGADEIYPNHQITALLYGQDFRERSPEAAVGFLVAYVRGAREYNAVMASSDRLPVYQILTQYTPIKDLGVYPLMHASGIHADGALNVPSLEADQELWARQGHIQYKADLATAIDLRYLQTAWQRLDGTR